MTNVVSRKHRLNKLVLNVRPYYENVGSLAYLETLFKKSSEIKPPTNTDSVTGELSSQTQQQPQQKKQPRHSLLALPTNYATFDTIAPPPKTSSSFVSATGLATSRNNKKSNKNVSEFLSSSRSRQTSRSRTSQTSGGGGQLLDLRTLNGGQHHHQNQVSATKAESKQNNNNNNSNNDNNKIKLGSFVKEIIFDLTESSSINNEKDSLDTFYTDQNTVINRESDLLRKPAVNLPRLDNGHISLDSYQNSIKRQQKQNPTENLKPPQQPAKQPAATQRTHAARDSKPPLPKILKPPTVSFANNNATKTGDQVTSSFDPSPNTPKQPSSTSTPNKSVMLRLPPPPKIVTKAAHNKNSSQIRAKSCSLAPCMGTKFTANEGVYKCDLSTQSCDYAEKLRRLRANSAKKFISFTPAPQSATKLAIVNHYGNNTLAEASNKLNEAQIDFIESTHYIRKLKLLYPKTSINLNATMRRVYIFGDRVQVLDAKEKLWNDLEHLATPPLPLPTSMQPSSSSSTPFALRQQTSKNQASNTFINMEKFKSAVSYSGNFADSGDFHVSPAAAIATNAKVVNKETFDNFINSLLVKYN